VLNDCVIIVLQKDNEVVKKWGDCRIETGLKHHHELLYMIDGYDSARGKVLEG